MIVAAPHDALKIPNSLSGIARVVGFLVSWSTTIYFLWVRKSKTAITALLDFPQVEKITLATISIFLAVSWGSLATSDGIRVLRVLAMSLTGFGITLLFVALYLARKFLPLKAAQPAVSICFLLVFFIYSSTISCGLASAGEFVTFLVLNPDNNKLGLTFDPPEQYSVTLSFTSTQSPTVIAAKPLGANSVSQAIPFTKSSGQASFGCEENHSFEVRVPLPKDAALVSTPSLNWLNTSNIGSQVNPVVTTHPTADGVEVVANGSLIGVSYQNFGFAKNCPGGGHGELVVSGAYTLPVKAVAEERKPEDTSRGNVLKSKVQGSSSEPVWVTLTAGTILSVDIDFQSERALDHHAHLQLSKQQLRASHGRYIASWDVPNNRVGLRVQSAWQQLISKFHSD